MAADELMLWLQLLTDSNYFENGCWWVDVVTSIAVVET